MKRNLSVLCLLLFGLSLAIGQEGSDIKYPASPVLVTIPIQRTDAKVQSKYVGSFLLPELQKIIGARFVSSLSSLYKLVPSYGVQEVRVIETFEKKYYADLDIYLRIRGMGFFKDSLLYKYSGTGSGEDEKTAVQKAMHSIFETKNFTGIADKIDSLFHHRYGIHGAATLQALKTLPMTTAKECDILLKELGYFNDHAEMQSQVLAFRDEIYKKRSELFCTTDLPELKIKVASTLYSEVDVINKLLSIPPNASCSAEILQLAKEIGSQLQAKKVTQAPDQLILLIEIHRDRNLELWRNRKL